MTSIHSFDTDYMLERNSDRYLCSAISTLDHQYNELNKKLTGSFFHPNELLGKNRADLKQLFFDDQSAMQQGLCDPKTTLTRQGNATKRPASSHHTFLIQPCNNAKERMFDNHIECNRDVCCSVRHELFDNQTKRH